MKPLSLKYSETFNNSLIVTKELNISPLAYNQGYQLLHLKYVKLYFTFKLKQFINIFLFAGLINSILFILPLFTIIFRETDERKIKNT